MTRVGGIAADQLKAYIEKIEKLEEQKVEIAEEIRGVFAEAKFSGFDVKIMRKVLKLRKMDSQERDEEEELLDLYKFALGIGVPPARENPEESSEMNQAA